MARVEAKLASLQSEAKEKGKLRNEPLDRSTRLFVGTALQSGDQVRSCVCQRLDRHTASCESRTYEVLDQVVSSVANTTEKRFISQKMPRLPHFSALGRASPRSAHALPAPSAHEETTIKVSSWRISTARVLRRSCQTACSCLWEVLLEQPAATKHLASGVCGGFN